MILITGGSGSGKSEYAENLAVNLCKTKLVYIATMLPYDDECIHRIDKHRKMRKEKGFDTIEYYTDIKRLQLEGKPTVLLECMSNLLANEMYSDESQIKRFGSSHIRDEIVDGINKLDTMCENLIIVSNEVFSDNGSEYEETNGYIKLLGEINCYITSLSSMVYEIVCGIPIVIKEI